jgi:hypothetical protein
VKSAGSMAEMRVAQMDEMKAVPKGVTKVVLSVRMSVDSTADQKAASWAVESAGK